jgi:spermidine synthase
VDLFGTYAGSRTDMQGWLKDAIINRDRNLKLQYLAGLGLNLYRSADIFRGMVVDTRYPDHLFEGSPETLAALRAEIDRQLAISRPAF